jgi:hypothetical protein
LFLKDKDECRETPEVCGQFCRNIPGGYTCSCSVGFELRGDQSGRCTGTYVLYHYS